MNHYLQQLQREISKTGCDIKAEAILAQALENGLLFEDFMVSCDSLFYREHNKDIVYTDIKEDARKLPLLQVHVSRSGLYDHLPEGIFFQPSASKYSDNSAAAMAAEYRMNQQKEESVRRMFLPFENDFFWQRLQLEAEESHLLNGLQSDILGDFFTLFWGISSSVPKSFVLSLFPLLPYAHRIAGNLPVTAQCLEELLGEPVRISMADAPATTASCFEQPLGQQKLGADMVCGNSFDEDYPVITFIIGPLQNSLVSDYLEGGNRMELLQTFYRFFIPAEADVITQIELPATEKSMWLQPGNSSVLGYTELGICQPVI